MIELGKYNLLKVVSVGKEGAVVTDGEKQLTMPPHHCDDTVIMDAELELFVFRTGQDRMIATTKKPKAVVGQFAPLQVIAVGENGAFLNWGMEKDLFVPGNQMVGEMQEGKIYVVHILLDDISNRIIATQRLRPFLKIPTEETLPIGTKVRAMIIENRENGSAAIARGCRAQFERNEFPDQPKLGKIFDAYVKRYNEFGQLTISRKPIVHEGWNEVETQLVELLEENNGFLPINDHSAPAAINDLTGMSKKSFKKVVGGLLKRRKLKITVEGIELLELPNS